MSNDSMPAKVRLTDGLGPLPEPALWEDSIHDAPAMAYTADQMRKYAAQQVAAERERWRDAIEALAHSWDDPAEAYGMRLALKEGLRA